MGFSRYLKFAHRKSTALTSILHYPSHSPYRSKSQVGFIRFRFNCILLQTGRFQINDLQMSHRSIHGGLIKTLLPDSTKEETLNLVTSQKIIQNTEKICRLLSNYSSDSSIEASLDTLSIELSPELVVEVLRKLGNAGVIALSFFRWAEKQCGFEYTTESYNALIEALGKIKQFNMIWALVNDMMRKNLLTNETFSLIIRRYARSRKIKESIETFEKMERFGMKPELSDFSKLLDNLCKSRHVKSAQEVFDKMTKRRFTPDIKSFTILLEGWSQERNFLKLNEVYREMVEDGFEADVVAYGIIINAHLKAGKSNEAIKIFHEMKCKATPHIYCSLINGLGSLKRLEEALNIFEQYKTNGFAPEVPTYNAVIGAYCWSMRISDAYRIIDEMRNNGIAPNSRTYDIILRHLIKSRRTKEAHLIFQKMSNEQGCEPSISTYEIISRMFCNEQRIDMAIKVWDMMKAKGVLPGVHMFSTLVYSLCRENRVDDASKYFGDMLDFGIRPSNHMFGNFKQVLLDEGKQDVAVILGLKLDKLRKTQLAELG